MKPIVFLDFDGVVETIYWEKDKDSSWSYNIHKYGHDELNNKQDILSQPAKRSGSWNV